MKSSKHIFKTIGFAFVTVIAILIVAVGGLLIATRGEYTVPDTVATDPSLPHINLDGVAFHAEAFGDPANPVIVVVHGGPGGDYGYLLNLHQLEDDYFVVFYDQRGAGLSPRVPAEELTLQSSIEDLNRIVDHYAQGQPVRLIGHSWGAMLAAGYVGQYPGRVLQVILAEPGALDNIGLDRFNERQTSTRGAAYYRLLVPTIFEGIHAVKPDDSAMMDYIFGKMSADFVNTAASGYRCADTSIAAMPPDVPAPPSRFGATAYQTLFGPNADLSPIATNAVKFHGEVLFMASECNTFTGAEFQQTQMDLFPQAELVVIPNAGHEMFTENPVASLNAVRTFFSE